MGSTSIIENVGGGIVEEIENGTPSVDVGSAFALDFSLPFSEAVKDLRTSKGRRLKAGSDNYHVLAALFRGEVIDDYHRCPVNYDGKRIYNIKSRISSLRHTYGIDIQSRRADGQAYVEYWIEAAVVHNEK